MKTFFNPLMLILFPLFVFGQTVKNADFISPLEDGYASVGISGQWGFINEKGVLAVNLRDDLIYNENPAITTENNGPSLSQDTCGKSNEQKEQKICSCTI